MSSSENTLRLGLVDLPTLVEPLTAAGFHLFGGGPFREAAAEIKSAAEQGPVAAIFVADIPQPGIKAWLTRMTTHGAVVVILRGDLPRLEVDGAQSVDLPATVGELLAAAGLTASDPAAAAARIGVDGESIGSSAAQSSPVAPAETIPAKKTPATKAPAAKTPVAKTASAKSPTKIPADPAPDSKPSPEPAPDTRPAVQASPILFAAQRRAETRPPADEHPVDEQPAENSTLFQIPPAITPPTATPAITSSPWDDDAPDVPTRSVPTPAVPTPAVPAFAVPVQPAPMPVIPAVPDASPASPWDTYPSAPEAEPYAAPPAREEDWFGQPPALPPRTSQPTPQAPASPMPGGVAQTPFDTSTTRSAPQYSDYADLRRPEPNDRQPVAYQDDPWGQGPEDQAAPVAVLTKHEQTKHDVPEPIFTAPTYAPAPEPIYEQPVYDPTPEYANPQDAVDAMFAAGTPPETAPQVQAPRRIRGHGAPLAIVCAEKGGVGKTNTTLALAQRAADRAPGKLVVLVDMNRGQGDVRKYLKLGGAQVPSILDAAISGNIAEAVLSPEQVTAARHSSLPPISFGVVLAPEPEAADPRIVTPDVYQRVIDLVRDQADLVVIDTQIIEIHDTSGLVDGLIVPALAHDAFGVTLTDTSAPGVSNLVTMLGYFAQQGVPANRLMIVINRALAGYDTNVLRGMLGKYGTFTGAVEEKSLLARQANMGRIPHNDPSLAPVLDAVLLRITGWPCFQPGPASSGKKKKLFAGFGRKAKN